MFNFKKERYYPIFVLIVLLILFPAAAFTQSALTFSASPLYSIPVGSSSKLYQYGIGGDLQIKSILPPEGFEAYGNIQYQNIALLAGAGNLNLLLFGGGASYIPFKAGIFSVSVFAGSGGYLGFFQRNQPLFNPYVSAGALLNFSLSDSFQLFFKPSYKNLMRLRNPPPLVVVMD